MYTHAFIKAIKSSEILVYYDSNNMAADALAYGVISHVSEKSLSFVKRTLTNNEHNEALASVFGVKKFHQYLYRL